MYAQSLIVGNLPTLNPLDNFEQALATMTAFHVQHLPVVDENGQYLGLLEEHAFPAAGRSRDKHMVDLAQISSDKAIHRFTHKKRVRLA